MKMPEEVMNRLYNWKFESAKDNLDGAFLFKTLEYTPDMEEFINGVEALSSAYGNVGWFNGSTGVIVSMLVDYLHLMAGQSGDTSNVDD